MEAIIHKLSFCTEKLRIEKFGLCLKCPHKEIFLLITRVKEEFFPASKGFVWSGGYGDDYLDVYIYIYIYILCLLFLFTLRSINHFLLSSI